jgi:AraC-like DNA-binding protein
MTGAMSVGGAFRVLLSELASVGLDPARVCADAGVDPRAPEDATVAIGTGELARVLERAEAVAGDALLGLHMAERARGRGVLSYLARAQQTVGDGLRAFERFAAATWGGAAVRIARHGTRVFVGFRPGAGLPRHAVEYVVGRTAISLRRSGARAREVWFGHAAGAPIRGYEQVLRCRVRFERSETGLVLRADELARPLRTASPEAAAAITAGLAGLPGRRATSASARLAAAVSDALARRGRLDREALARSLGMSGRTLARRLATEQCRFRDVVEAARRTLAQRLVEEEALGLAEVAGRVGFADAAAFGKAFRRWFGDSPSAFRARPRRPAAMGAADDERVRRREPAGRPGRVRLTD